MRIFSVRTFDGLDDPKVKITPDGRRGRRDRLVQTLSTRVVLYAREVATHAYQQGLQARQLTPEMLAHSEIVALRGGSSD